MELAWGGWFYSDKIFEEQSFSRGLQTKQTIFFLSSLHRFRRPVGLMTFPDGGQPKTLSFEVSIFQYNIKNKKLEKLAILTRKKEIGINIKGTKILLKDNLLTFMFRCRNVQNRNIRTHCIHQFSLEKSQEVKLQKTKKNSLVENNFLNYWERYRDILIQISVLKNHFLNTIPATIWNFE